MWTLHVILRGMCTYTYTMQQLDNKSEAMNFKGCGESYNRSVWMKGKKGGIF